METLRSVVSISALVCESLEGDVPVDILERLERRVDEDRFFSRAGVRTHAVAALVKVPVGYRESERGTEVPFVAHGSSALEDVRFRLDGQRLLYEVRFPKFRLFMSVAWCFLVFVPAAAGLAVLCTRSEGVYAWVASAFLVAVLLAWFFIAWSIRDVRNEIRSDVLRIVREASE